MAENKNITGNILRNAITKKLTSYCSTATLFSANIPKVYNERKLQDFEENSFFVFQVNSGQTPATLAYSKRDYMFSITFFPPKDSNVFYALIEDVKELLFEALSIIEIPTLIDANEVKKLITGKNLMGVVSDGVLVFTVDFTLFVKPYEPQGDLMEELQMELIPALDYKEGIFIEKFKEV